MAVPPAEDPSNFGMVDPKREALREAQHLLNDEKELYPLLAIDPQFRTPLQEQRIEELSKSIASHANVIYNTLQYDPLFKEAAYTLSYQCNFLAEDIGQFAGLMGQTQEWIQHLGG